MLSRARFSHPIEVRFRDLDALGHVNNAVYLTYLESARIAYWLHVTGRSGLDALDMILARVEIDYRSPLSYGEAVDVSVRCASMRRSSFVLEFARSWSAARAGWWPRPGRSSSTTTTPPRGRSRLPSELRDLLRAQDPDVRDEAAP